MPAGLLDRICEMRVFVATKARVAMAKQDSDIEGLPLLDVVIGLLEESVKEGHGR